MAQAEVLNQESLAKQVLQETFGYQQFRPARNDYRDGARRPGLHGGHADRWRQVAVLSGAGAGHGRSDGRGLTADLADEGRVDQLLANGVAAACLNSTQSREQQQEVMAGCRSGQVRLLYIAPERLMLDNFLEHLANWNWRCWR